MSVPIKVDERLVQLKHRLAQSALAVTDLSEALVGVNDDCDITCDNATDLLVM